MAQRKTSTKSGSRRTSGKTTTKSASRSAKGRTGKAKTTTKRPAAKQARSSGSDEVTIDRRRKADRRDDEETTPEKTSPAAPKLERRQKVNRRRQIDPTTCERDYSEDEIEFMNALDDYKRKSGRMFPTCSEVLEVVRSLGYAKSLSNAAGGHADEGAAWTSA